MSPGAYIGRRLMQAVPLIVGAVLVNFILIHVAPGDPASIMAGPDASPEYIAALTREFGLDQPLWRQLACYVSSVARGSLGYSLMYRRQVLATVAERVPATLLLVGTSLLFALLVGTVIGVSASTRAYSPWDSLVSVMSLVAYSMPIFWLGLMLILVFGLRLGWTPAQGMRSVRYDMSGISLAWDIARHLVLPALALGLSQMALYTRLTRSSMLEVLREDYIRTANAEGFPRQRVLYRYALRNAILPTITAAGVQLGFLFAGSVLVETVFAWPGMGRLMYQALSGRDYPLIMGVFLVVSVCIVLASLLTDVIYSLVDPRIRLGGGRPA